ncbi:hypothetical protein G4307_01630 [Dorea longicatena]|uniref:hypothetical protein n=1 Tax=Dorea longicatena TaxID=88431 RepID=UPI001FB9A560|nr:hypothetical protein [Dorea longicatena]NSE34948.1 hypothetical protein [Dorea longicatena]
MVSVDQVYMIGHMKNADGSINNKNVVLSAACEAAELFQCMMAVNQKLEDWQRFNHTLEMHLRSVECEKIHDICQELLRMSHTTVTKLLYELDSVHGIGLIERYRQGNNRPSVIYVKNFVKRSRGKPVRYFASGTPETGNPDCKELEIRIARNWKSGTQKNRSPDCKNLDGSNTKINKTEKNHTDKSKGNTPTLEEKFSQYGRFKNVVLSEAELQELMTLFPWDYQKRIDHLSVYMKSSGKEYQNHFATICLWAERDGTRAGMDKYEFQEGESL